MIRSAIFVFFLFVCDNYFVETPYFWKEVGNNKHVLDWKEWIGSGKACEASKECLKLSEAIVYEARGESLKGRKYVAEVILNRRDDSKEFGRYNTVVAVVHQGRHFSYLSDMHKQTPPSEDDFRKSKELAYKLLSGLEDRELPPTVLWYMRKDVNRVWTKSLNVHIIVGQHKFYSKGLK